MLNGAPIFERHDDQPHARRIPRECKSAAQFVQLLFPQALMDQLVLNTNAAATQHPRLCNQQRYLQWRAVTREEMTLFLAICVYLGVVKVQSRKLIWRRGGIFEQKWVTQRMSLRRFETILNAFNCCEYWTLTDDEYAAKNAADPFWQIQELVSVCNERCAFHFKMGRTFSIDEAVIPWKGKHKARCYNPKKPAKYHLKKFSLNCAATGYVYCHYHYGGKDERRPAGVPASVWPIKKLVDQCELLHDKNHLCATDNWYTCAQSLSYLRRRGIHSVGTIKKGRLCPETATRPGFPQAGIFKAARGQPKRARADCMIHATEVDVLIDLFTSMLLNAYVLHQLHNKANHNTTHARYTSFDFIADWLSEVAPEVDESHSDQHSDTDDDGGPPPAPGLFTKPTVANGGAQMMEMLFAWTNAIIVLRTLAMFIRSLRSKQVQMVRKLRCAMTCVAIVCSAASATATHFVHYAKCHCVWVIAAAIFTPSPRCPCSTKDE